MKLSHLLLFTLFFALPSLVATTPMAPEDAKTTQNFVEIFHTTVAVTHPARLMMSSQKALKLHPHIIIA